MNPLEYLQLKAFARQDGTFLGLIWIASFACFIGEFYNPTLGLVAMILAVISPFFVAMRLRKFRDKERNGAISFRHSLAFSILAFFYASLLFAITQYIYFRYIDHGFLVNQYNTMFSSPETKELMKKLSAGREIQQGINMLGTMRPIEIVLNFLSVNISTGIILSIPIALLLKSNRTINPINNQQ